jgi:hypothetical protein
MIFLLTATALAELAVNSGLVPATGVLLESRNLWGLPRLEVDHVETAGQLAAPHALTFGL